MVFKKIFGYFRFLKNDNVIFKVKDKSISFNIKFLDFRDFKDYFDIKKKIVFYYLNRIPLNQSFRIHLFNQLFSNSDIFHKKTCLFKFLLDNNFDIDSISAPFLSKNDLQLANELKIKVKNFKQKKIRDKILQNKWFLLCSSLFINFSSYKSNLKQYNSIRPKFDSKIKYNTLLRAWVEVSENIYLNKLSKSFETTIIQLNPFYIQPKRQQKYFKQLYKEKRNFFFSKPIKMDISTLKKIIKVIYLKIPNEMKTSLITILISRYEIDKNFDFVLKSFPHIKEVYTKEEFDPNTTYLTEKFQENDIKVINSAHGLGVYCPIVNYDTFYIYNEVQKSYYQGNSQIKYFESKKKFEKKENENNNKPLALFFIGQNIISYVESVIMKRLYRTIIEYIEDLIKDLKIPIFLKYHPNSTNEDKVFSKAIKIVEDVTELPPENKYLAITMHSTYALELINRMPYIIINPQKKLELKYYFSREILQAHSYKHLKDIIKSFLEQNDYYQEYWETLV